MHEGVTVYKLKDFANENLSGTYYSQELQKMITQMAYGKSVKYLRREKNASGETELSFSWTQWPSKFDSGIKESELHQRS